MIKNIYRKSLVIGIIILFVGASIIPSIGVTIVEKHVRSTIGGDTLYVSGSGPGTYSLMPAKFTDNLNDPDESSVVVDLSATGIAYNGQTIYGTIEHDGLQREYILYIPESYTGNDSMPLVFNFHGYTSSAESQMNYADFRPIADTAGFLVVHPQGTLDNYGNTYWNVGGFWHPGGTADDVGFTDALIDSIAFNYSISMTRIYATGFSNGGFFSFHLASQLSDRIAAIAPVAGTMTPYTFNNYDPQHPTPILQTHGTADYIVPYYGSTWSLSVDTVLEYWVNFNNCNPNPTITHLPDIDPYDGSTVTHIVYDEGDNGVTVEHFKVIGGGHDWPGSSFGGNQDIDACVEIWQFFSNYSLGTIYVDDDADPSWYDAIHVKTIQEGIDNASSEDTVFVYNGTYYENVVVYKSLNLIGEDKKTTIIDGGGSNDVVNVSVDWVNISGFTIRNGYHGIELDDSSSNTITGNIISDNWNGIHIGYSSDNTIYHNNFINNAENAYDEGDNTWENGYPSGGNYWDDYDGEDNFHGPNQDIPGSDDIGDTPYPISGGENVDKYPLMIPFVNVPPNAPTITGETNGKAGIEYEYTFNAVDPNGDDVKYHIDWDDGDSDTTAFSPSGTDVKVKHTWNSEGTYTIRAKAEDEFGLFGPEATFGISITKKTRAINTPFQWFLQQHLNLFPILQTLLQRLGLR